MFVFDYQLVGNHGIFLTTKKSIFILRIPGLFIYLQSNSGY